MSSGTLEARVVDWKKEQSMTRGRNGRYSRLWIKIGGDPSFFFIFFSLSGLLISSVQLGLERGQLQPHERHGQTAMKSYSLTES